VPYGVKILPRTDDTAKLRRTIRRIKVVTDRGCWILPPRLSTQQGRPMLTVKGYKVRLARAVYEIWYGPLGKKFALHSCDNERCFNPVHLWKGTQKQNIKDAAKKGRMYRGPHPWAPRGKDHFAYKNPKKWKVHLKKMILGQEGRRPTGSNHWSKRHPIRWKEMLLERERKRKSVI